MSPPERLRVHLDDLAEPRFSPEAEQIRDMMAALAADCPLNADALHARAIADTGLDDFGPDDYRERLDVYLVALHDIDDMHGPGIVNFFGQLSQWLKNRLLLTDLVTRHPEIHDIELLPPVVIAGLPRTGTTHLHNLLGAASSDGRLSPPGTFRTLPYWESFEPFPLPAEVGVEPEPGAAGVCTHREPVPVALSMVAMLTYSARMHRSVVPVEKIAAEWIDRLELMLAALARDRAVIAPERSIDVRFDDFMADELGVAERVFGLVGEPVTDGARNAMADYLAGHQRGRLGRVVTSCEMFGLNEEDLRERFAPYVNRFLS